ncbi:Neurexin-3-beta [Schistosoma haematobium]|uniref:Neurexin-3-beta n=1 Tax=Schistosoma haematobium TaxID=6185 RepID=A0A922IH95_SCHHA|nr:Neurexin-3-beta [Schistosoma haematobium]KAH9579165.1 Neurexin-3-beta [Schistosoma haematobium]
MDLFIFIHLIILILCNPIGIHSFIVNNHSHISLWLSNNNDDDAWITTHLQALNGYNQTNHHDPFYRINRSIANNLLNDKIRLVDGNQLAHVLLNTNNLQNHYHQLIAKSVIGSPYLNIDPNGLPTSIQFPAEPVSGLFLTPAILEQTNNLLDQFNTFGCPWNLTACVSGEFTIRFGLLPEQTTPNSKTHILSFIASYFTNQEKLPWLLEFYIFTDNLLIINWNQLSNKSISNIIIPLTINQWNIIETTINLKTNHLIVKNNNQQYKSNNISNDNHEYPWLPMVTMHKMESFKQFIGLLFGHATQLQMNTNQSIINFALNHFYIESSDIVKYRKPKDLMNVLDQIPTNPIKYISSVNFPEGSFVRYDFMNRLQRTVEEEVLTINFTLPFGVTSGLLWFSESDQSKSYVYIKNSLLYYIYAITDQTGKAQRTVTEEIFLNSSLIPEKPQVLQLIRDRDNVSWN